MYRLYRYGELKLETGNYRELVRTIRRIPFNSAKEYVVFDDRHYTWVHTGCWVVIESIVEMGKSDADGADDIARLVGLHDEYSRHKSGEKIVSTDWLFPEKEASAKREVEVQKRKHPFTHNMHDGEPEGCSRHEKLLVGSRHTRGYEAARTVVQMISGRECINKMLTYLGCWDGVHRYIYSYNTYNLGVVEFPAEEQDFRMETKTVSGKQIHPFVHNMRYGKAIGYSRHVTMVVGNRTSRVAGNAFDVAKMIMGRMCCDKMFYYLGRVDGVQRYIYVDHIFELRQKNLWVKIGSGSAPKL